MHWKQEVQLQDEWVIIIGRVSVETRTIFPENISMEKSQHIEFVNPATNEKVICDIPRGLKPYALDFKNQVPYLVLNAYTAADYSKRDCPNSPCLVYCYSKMPWTAIPFEQLPNTDAKFNRYVKRVSAI